MSQKLINTRIGLKYDTYANWTKVVDGVAFDTTFIPLKGEVIFYEIPTTDPNVDVNVDNLSKPQTPPAILFKVGDGETSLHNLAWGSAIAADVYDWAKQQSLLGGERTGSGSGAGWDFSHATSIQLDTQREVGGFIGNLVKIRVTPVTGQDNTYVIEVSTDGGESWTPSGTITMTTETYTGDNQTIQVNANNEISVIPAELSYESGSGLDIENENGVLTGSDVQPILDAVKDMSEVTVEKLSTATSGYASSYIVKQNGVQVGDTIDIPKDFVVKSATVETCETADVPVQGLVPGDKYIDLVINTVDQSATSTHLYIPVKDLVDPYTGGSTTYINVGINGNVITATLKDEMIADEIGSGTGDDLLTTVDAVRDYVQSEISQATPNLTGVEAIEVGPGSGSGIDTTEVSLKLDESSTISGSDQVSGLTQSNAGLKIDDTLTWILQCGGASSEE